MADKLMTPEFRGSYCNLLKPKVRKGAKPGDDPKYSMLIVLSKTDKSAKVFLAKLEKEMLAASLEKHGKPIPKAKLKHWPIRDGDEENEDGEVDPTLAGHWCISINTKRKPNVIDTKNRKLIDDEEVYSGAYYRVTIRPWAWDNVEGGKGVSIELHNVLKTKDGDRLSGGVSKAEDDFKDHIDEDAVDNEDEGEDDLM